jgi:uncharacterized membrane protein YeaQ/YmgE (transglycosylase-associated protein family)
MGILGWIILGGLAGWIASMITRRNVQHGCMGNIIVGIVGAFIGGLVMRLLGIDLNVNAFGFNLSSFIVAIIGAVILLAGTEALGS